MNDLQDSKRQRVRQACDHCRGKKAKCDGVHPSCSTCLRNGVNCTYPPVKKRGLKTGYIHDLESKVQVLEAVLGALVDSGNENDIAKIVRGPTFLLAMQKNQDLWQQNRLFDVAARLCDGSVEPIPETSPSKQNEPVEPTGGKKEDGWTPETLQFHALSELVSGFFPGTAETLSAGERSPFKVASIFHVRSSEGGVVPPRVWQFPPDARSFLDTYFQVVHPCFPMLNRFHLIKYIHANADGAAAGGPLALTLVPAPARDCNTAALAWTVLACGQYVQEVAGGDKHKQLRAAAALAIEALENTTNSTVETIQTMLLLGYFHYCTGEWDKAWVLTSSAARMAIDVRLVQPSAQLSAGLPGELARDGSTRVRTWGVAFILNTLLSARMGRLPVIRSLDWPEIKINEDGWEEWDSWCDYSAPGSDRPPLSLENARYLSTFNYMFEITTVLNLAITSTIDTVGIGDSLFTPNVVTFDYLQFRLGTIKNHTPAHCRLDPNRPTPHYILFPELAYNLVLCVIGIRLSAVEEPEAYKYSKDRRDHMLAAGVQNLRTLLGSISRDRFLRLPYVDYFFTVCLTAPQTVKDACIATPTELYTLLAAAAQVLAPCKISNALVGVTQDFDMHLEKLDIPLNPPTIEKHLDSVDPMDPLDPLEKLSLDKLAFKLDPRRVPMLPDLYRVFDRMSPVELTMVDSDKSEETDGFEAFMMTANISDYGVRQDRFLKNLGFVGATPKTD